MCKKTTWLKTSLKIAALLGLGLTTMANESCQEQPIIEARKIKKVAEIGRINTGQFSLPGGASLDMQAITESQLYSLITQSKDFTVLASGPQIGMAASDRSLMKAWAPAQQKVTIQDFSQEAACLLDLPQVIVDVDLVAFQATGQGGINIGFGPGGSYTSGLAPGVNFNMSSAQLNMNMYGGDSLSGAVLGSAEGVSYYKKYDIAAILNLGSIGIGPKFYFESALADVSRTGLDQALKALATNLASDPWYTRVVGDFGSHIAIGAGSLSNLKIGDVVSVYNETHYWEAEPCESELKGSYKEPSTPILKAKIVSLGNTIARAEVLTEGLGDLRPEIGARVEIFELAPETVETSAQR